MSSATSVEQRILVLAPIGRDGALACQVLTRAGLAAEPCRDISSLCSALESGAGALLLGEEVLSPAAQRQLSDLLVRQPPWSDLPIVIFAAAVGTQASTARMEQMLGVLGNVTFVERPVRVATLVTAMRAALRARQRQYLARQTLLALERQEEDVRKRADFEQHLIGIVSHDLRNPLHVILLSAQGLLHREDLDDRTTRAIVRIHSSVQRAGRLIRDLLDFTQARLGGGIPLQLRPLDLHELARQVVEEIEPSYPERKLLARCEGDGRGEWDGDRTAQVLTNLVTNAVKYSPADTPVTVSTRGEEAWVVVEILNQGPPIPDDVRQRLFEPMRRGSSEVDKTGRSVGLGLYIVKHLVEAHGGTVEVTSTAEQGTLFKIRLPRAPPLGSGKVQAG